MNRWGLMLAASLSLAITGCNQTGTEAEAAPQDQAVALDVLQAAVDNSARPEQARALDESRKPAEILQFLGLQEGDHVADVVSGGGYWAEIMADAVGEDGSVTALEPEQFYSEEVWSALTERQPEIALERYRFEKLEAGTDRFDFAILNLVYHDTYWESEQYDVPRSEPRDFLAALYGAMKPGGIVGVIDHTGPEGDTRQVVEDMHRIDPAVVKADFLEAGFELEATSDMLANPDDDLTLNVFNPEIRGKTDRFVYRFRKPAD